MINLNNSPFVLTLETRINTDKVLKDFKEVSSKVQIVPKIILDKKPFIDITKTTTKLKNDFNQIATMVTLVDKNGKLLSKTITSVAESTKKAKQGFSDISESSKKASQGFTDIIGKVLKFGTATLIINEVRQALMDGVKAVFDMDSALVELQKVTDLTGDSLDRFVKKATDMGEDVAKSGREMVMASTEFSKSGFDENESLQLARISEMYRNIADEQISVGDSAGFIISQMKAFNLTSTDSLHIISAVNEVSNKYAVSSADLATNIGKVSATMASSGVSYEQTLGLMTAITEITRQGGKAANALKTISQRIRGVGEDAEEGLTGKLQSAFDEFNIGIQIVNQSTGEMADSFSILKAMADNWDNLTESQQQYLGELAAG